MLVIFYLTVLMQEFLNWGWGWVSPCHELYIDLAKNWRLRSVS